MDKYLLKKYRTKNNLEIELREAQVADASLILDFARIAFTTSPYTLTQASDFHFSIDLEEKWIDSTQKSKTSLILIALFNQKVIGIIDLRGSHLKRVEHRVQLGMTLLPDWRNQGIGRFMLSEIIEYCKRNEVIKKLELGVIEENTPAVQLYSSLGFINEGKSIKGFYSDVHQYLDEVHMGLWVG